MSAAPPIAGPATYEDVRRAVGTRLTEILGSGFDPEKTTAHDRLIQQRLEQEWRTIAAREPDGPLRPAFDRFMQRQADVFRIGRHVARSGHSRSERAPAYALVEDLNAQIMHFFIEELRATLEAHPGQEAQADLLPLIKKAVGSTLKAFSVIGDTHRIYPLWIEMEQSERNLDGIERAIDRIADQSPRGR